MSDGAVAGTGGPGRGRAGGDQPGLCGSCAWDCVQPIGVTVTCPYWRRRGPEECRKSRTGQMSFGFGGPGGEQRAARRRADQEEAPEPGTGARVAKRARRKAAQRTAGGEPEWDGLFAKPRRRLRRK